MTMAWPVRRVDLRPGDAYSLAGLVNVGRLLKDNGEPYADYTVVRLPVWRWMTREDGGVYDPMGPCVERGWFRLWWVSKTIYSDGRADESKGSWWKWVPATTVKRWRVTGPNSCVRLV